MLKPPVAAVEDEPLIVDLSSVVDSDGMGSLV